MKMKSFTLGLALAILLSATSLQAQEQIKIAVVNFKSCVEKSKLGKEEQKEFEGLKKQMETALEGKEKAITEISSKFQDPDYLDTLSADAEAELKHKFRMLSQEMNQLQGQYYQALQQANFKIIQKLSEHVKEAAEQVAKSKGYDVVLNDESAFYYAPKLDISSEVIAVLDKKADAEKSKP